MADRSALYDAIVKKFGKAKADDFFTIAEDDDFARSVFVLGGGTSSAKAAQACATLGAFILGKAPADALPTAISDALTGLQNALGLDPQLILDAEDRPKIQGLPEMLREVAQAKDEAGAILPMLRADPAKLRSQAAQIEMLRSLFNTERSSLRITYTNLIKAERTGQDMVKDDYTTAREFIRKHGGLAPKFMGTDNFFFGAALTGAKTARDNRARDEKRTDSLQAIADDRADDKARTRTAEKLKAVAQALSGDTPEDDAPAPAPANPKRKTPR